MKILLYSINFAPEPTGIGKYSGEMAAWLVERGHDVRVVCSPPYYPAWRLDRALAWPPFRRQAWHGVDVWRAPVWVPASPSSLLRVIHLISFAVLSLPVVLLQLWWRPKIIMIVAPAIVCAPMALVAARVCGAKTWLHVQDFEVDVAIRMGLAQSPRVRQFVLSAEQWLLGRFDRVSSISRRMRERLIEKKVIPERIRRLRNWVDVSTTKPLGRVSRYRDSLEIKQDAVVALFSGSLGGKQGLPMIPKAARLLSDRQDIVFVICGSGVMWDALAAECSALPNTRLIPLQPSEQLPELLGVADIHLLTQSPIAEDLVLPSKLSGMLASGKPVVATCRSDTEIAEIVESCGVVTPPEDERAFAAAIVSLADDPGRRQRLGLAARRYAEDHMAMDAILTQLDLDLEELVSTHVPGREATPHG